MSDPDGDSSLTHFDEDENQYYELTTNEDTIAKFENYFIPWRSDHETFCLDSFEFHWGSSDLYGSEHYVDGGAYPLEVHFVHYSWYDLLPHKPVHPMSTNLCTLCLYTLPDTLSLIVTV